MLYSCDNGGDVHSAVNEETLMTEESENLSIVMSENGRKSYFFKTPLLEGYMLARDPYREFRKGISITTYQDDSMSTVNATLTSNYAIYYENRKLWEAKGDVVVIKADGTELYTQQLFWNSMTKRIYSNVDTKIVKGADVFYGEGFESDEEIKQWKFRRMTGRMFVKLKPGEEDEEQESSDSAVETKDESGNAAPKSAAAEPAKPARPVESPLRSDENPESEARRGKQLPEKKKLNRMDSESGSADKPVDDNASKRDEVMPRRRRMAEE